MREKYMAGLEKSRMATSQSPNKNERKNSLGGVFSTMQISPDFFTKTNSKKFGNITPNTSQVNFRDLSFSAKLSTL
ncbi:hypothetical protein [Muribaculum intestinale]|jgi:hypothetical protein|uniref:hypothetical protein n=2 Tax=Muribaculum intestinale TaxID=1796646 RepID=UPI000FFE6AF5|nr:hypothetical protein [Muribaculum intestinale]RXE65603.1 hypothetical protein ED388_06935 [Muribaculaceae bacterium Isolate-007 (NCI)]